MTAVRVQRFRTGRLIGATCAAAGMIGLVLVHSGPASPSTRNASAPSPIGGCAWLNTTPDLFYISWNPDVPPQTGRTLSPAPISFSDCGNRPYTGASALFSWQRCLFLGAACLPKEPWTPSPSRTFAASDLESGTGRPYTWSLFIRAVLTDGTVYPIGNERTLEQRVTRTSGLRAAWPMPPVDALDEPVRPGDKLFADSGSSGEREASWDGGAHRYQWQECDEALISCRSVKGATTRTFTLDDVHVGKRLRFVVTAASGASAVSLASTIVAPPAAPIGVSINEGADFTNTPDVTLVIHAPVGATRAIVSNDGGFAQNKRLRIEPGERYRWVLRSTGPERLPKTVYVRFSGAGDGSQTFTDDIILDQTAPVIVSAVIEPEAARRLSRTGALPPTSGLSRLRVVATDNVSGVWKVQVNTPRARWLPYRSRLSVSGTASRVRVMDRAKNRSLWHVVSR